MRQIILAFLLGSGAASANTVTYYYSGQEFACAPERIVCTYATSTRNYPGQKGAILIDLDLYAGLGTTAGTKISLEAYDGSPNGSFGSWEIEAADGTIYSGVAAEKDFDGMVRGTGYMGSFLTSGIGGTNRMTLTFNRAGMIESWRGNSWTGGPDSDGSTYGNPMGTGGDYFGGGDYSLGQGVWRGAAPALVPIPAPIALLATGFLAMGALGRKRNRAA